MATSSVYYLNAPSLGSATAVFTNSTLVTCAADGFYSDGVIVREQVDCVLLPQQTCPTCDNVTYNCDSGNCVDPLDGSGTYSTLAECQAACISPVNYNYYTFEACNGGSPIDYRSILSLALYDVYAFQASPPDRTCYTITSITAASNVNDLPTLYGPKANCEDADCTQP